MASIPRKNIMSREAAATLHEGVLELSNKGFGFLRNPARNYLPQQADPYAARVPEQSLPPQSAQAMPAQPPEQAAQPTQLATNKSQGDRDHVLRYIGNDGQLVTVVSGQPHDPTPQPKPSFEQLDANHDGIITRDEAQAYLPLYNDYDNLVHHVAGITPHMYARWDQR